MKKIFQVRNIFIVRILLNPFSLYAYNAALVATIHDDDYTRVVTTEDLAQVTYLATDQGQSSGDNSRSATFVIDGAYERLQQSKGVQKKEGVEEINSQKTLENYAKTIARDNSNIMLITVETDSVSLTRATQVKLFGVLPVPTKETVEVISWGDGTNAVQVTSPWWGMFSSYPADNQELSSNMYKRMKEISPTLFSPTLTTTTKARIISEIQSAFNESQGVVMSASR